jgi:hypothetical protein
MAGLTFNAKSVLNEAEIKAKTAGEIKRLQAPLDAMVLADSNYFCPIKTGTLQKSAIINTQIGSGEVKWVTPYARKQYYEYSKPAYQPNPNACGRWFEAAKARWLDKWVRFINEQLKRS